MKATANTRRGLTFIEVLVGLSTFALIMLAAIILIHSMVQAHYTVETHSLFDQHTRGVTELVHTLAITSGAAGNTPGPSYRWARSPTPSREFTLSFRIDREMPFFVSDIIPLPPLTAFLEFDSENNQFWLVWFPDVRFTEGRQRLHYTLLSPWAADIEYGYYNRDQRNWEFSLASSGERSQGNRRPNQVTLVFERAGQVKRQTFSLEEGQQNVLHY